MTDATTTEITGFWMMAAGWLLCLFLLYMLTASREKAEKVTRWIEEKLRTGWITQMFVVALGGPMLLLVGWWIWAIGNAGRPWPGYPLDVIMRWMGW